MSSCVYEIPRLLRLLVLACMLIIYDVESAKMGKCGCCPFKIHKKKVFALLPVITKVFLLCDTNASKMGRNFVPSAERKSCKCQLKCQLNRVSPVPQKKKN